jgi:hypothetical protein
MISLKKMVLAILISGFAFYASACEKPCNAKPAPASTVKVSLNPQDKAFVQHVNVKFTVNHAGKIFVRKIDTESEKLKKFVLAKLARLHFEGMDVEGTYDITISFSSKEQLT